MNGQAAYPDNVESQELLDDACRFAQTFIRIIEQHPLQVYASALSFTPVNTTFYRRFHHTSQNPRIIMGADTAWSPLLLTFSDSKRCQCLSFSPDGMRMLSGTTDGAFYIHDATTGAPVLAPTRNQHVDIEQDLHRRCAFSPDGSWVVTVLMEDIQLDDDFRQLSTQVLNLWDSSSGAQIREPIVVSRSSIPIRDLIVSPDGTLIACCSTTTIYAFDVKSGMEVFSSTSPNVYSSYRVLAFSPDSTRIVSGSNSSRGSISCWDSSTGVEMLGPLTGHSSSILDVACDAKQILSVDGHGNVRIWDTLSGANILALSLQGIQELCYPAPGRVAFSADGQRLAVCTGKGRIGVWDPFSGVETRVITESGKSWKTTWGVIAWSRNGKVLASGRHDSVRLWDATASTNTQNRKLVPYIYSLDGKKIAFADKDDCVPNIIVLDAMSGAELCTLRGHSKSIPSVGFSPDGSLIVSGSHDQTIRVWDITTGTEMYALTEGHTDFINSVAFCPEGRRIVSASKDCTIRIWDTISRTTVLCLPEAHNEFTSAAFSPDGMRIVSHTRFRDVQVWDSESGAHILGPLVVPDDDPGPPVAFSPDGTAIGCSLADKYQWAGGSDPLMFDRWHQWDAITGTATASALPQVIHGCTPFDRFVIEKADMSIRDTITGSKLCWLPPLGFNKTASSQSSMVLTTDAGTIVMHFPPWMLSG
jgi:WD40 repeat protein